jgi:energy-coupling factor transporter transmembrane protein EcfT
MVGVTFFHYIHKETVLHRMDGRLKLFCMLLLSLSAGFAFKWLHYLIPICIIVLALWTAKLPIVALLKDMKFFGVIILIVFLSNAFAMPGDPIPNFPIASVSLQGVTAGLRFAGRLTIVIMTCAVITGTTSFMMLKNAIEWILRPVPFIPEVRVATMINLTFVLIPVIFDNYKEMMDAQKSRCIQLRKNPVKRIQFIVFPLLTQTLRRADEIVYAMESRCYSEVRTQAILKTNKIDWIILTICMMVLLFVLFL